jgi:hypothetical protein
MSPCCGAIVPVVNGFVSHMQAEHSVIAGEIFRSASFDDGHASRLRATLLAAGSPQRRSQLESRMLATALLELVGRDALGAAWEYAERNHSELLDADPATAYSRLRDAAVHGDRSRMAARTSVHTPEVLDFVASDRDATTFASPRGVSVPPLLVADWLEPLVGHRVTTFCADRLADTISVYVDSGSGMVSNGSCNPMARHRTRASSTQRLNNNPAIRSIFGADDFARLAACRLLVGTDKTNGVLAFLGARLRGDIAVTPDVSTRREWAKWLLDLDPSTRPGGPCTTGSSRWIARQAAADRVPQVIDISSLPVAV